MSFNGKVAVVTGGASGMGQISARRLAKQGAQVAILDVNEAGLKETAEGNPNIHPFVCNIASWEEVQQVVADVEAKLGPIDRLTHAAAIMPMGPLNTMPVELITKMMEINYFGTVHLTKAILPSMLKRDSGDMILFGSLAGEVITPKMGAYCATKAATNIYAEQLIRENVRSKVRFVLVCPPATDTPLIKQGLDANSRGLGALKEKGLLASPDFIIDQVEVSLEKGVSLLYPGKLAKALRFSRKMFPTLLWNTELWIERKG